jgi:hypothetical protein
LREGARQLDRAIGQRTRAAAALLLGMGWVVLPLIGHFHPATFHRGPMRILWPLVFIVAILGLAMWGRESLSKTAFNRRFIPALLFLMVAELMVATVAYAILALPVEVGGLIHTVAAVSALGMLALLFEPYLWIATVGNALALFATALWPEGHLLFVSAGNVTIVCSLLLAWRPALARRVPTA